ncbi:MAG: hypothetical protein HYX49_04615 [Chloroflexi bacterium]|nr:hypothetical protein [Chloroflexota bacterium]
MKNTRLFPDFRAAAVLSAIALTLAACAPKSTPTIFVAPTQPAQIVVITATVANISPTSIPIITPPTPTPPCTDILTYIQDLTIPDDTAVAPGQTIDKQWLVTNSGSCNWDARYRLKLITGDAMSASTEQALYPARAGSQATLRIIFTAPSDAGTYRSAWQAFGPNNEAFGDVIYIQINVTP